MSRARRKLDRASRDELVQAYLTVQRKYEEQGAIPKGRETLLSRYRHLWETAGAIHLGLLVAALSILFNFILVNLLLHLPPS